MVERVNFENFRGLDGLTVPLSTATMLTGVNGVGKTSVLEGLYCLFSETRLDVSHLSRNIASHGFNMNHASGTPLGISTRQNYNYKLFWDECPPHGRRECYVYARKADLFSSWDWEYKRAKISDLDPKMTEKSPIPIDSSTEFAFFKWGEQDDLFITGKMWECAQVLSRDGGFYTLNDCEAFKSVCRYIDFATFRTHPKKLTFTTAKKLRNALQIINPSITDVRLKDMDSGLSVVLNDEIEMSLGTLGNGAVTWASTLIEIFNLHEEMSKQQNNDIPVLILLDEMCAGIHYSAMLDVWKFFAEFLEQNPGIQFVFTSHSDDCIRAYCEAFSDTDNASIVRLHRTFKENKVVTTEYKKEAFPDIIDGNWEVRG